MFMLTPRSSAIRLIAPSSGAGAFGRPVGHELEPEQESATPHVADAVELVAQRFEPGPQPRYPELRRMLGV
jgi:hypothetical protein